VGAAPAGRAVAASPADEADEILSHIRELLAGEPSLPLPVRQRREPLQAYYSDPAARPLWLGTPRMGALAAHLGQADADGLDPADYPSAHLARLQAVADQTDAGSKAVIELFFSAALLEYASDLQVGRLLPRKVDPDFFLQSKTIDPQAALSGVARAANVAAFMRSWEPAARDYKVLRELLATYRSLARDGGWPAVPVAGPTLKQGDRDVRVPAIRARLAVTDGVAPRVVGEGDQLYDIGLVQAVRKFQARHGLDDDGNVGRATLVALNVPVAARIEQIIVAMERWRWLPVDFGAHHIVVNIAGFELKRVRGGKVEERMNVVVGKPGNRTPQFSDNLRIVEFNPYWNVPAGIAVKEELPSLQKNAAARDAAGFEAVRGSQVFPVGAIDWSQYGPGNFPFQLRQRPGPRNALGQVKFLFPNRFDVYLHDTPAKTLFDKSDRAFSHGCIRLSRPLDLAQQVLADMPGWDRRRINEAVATGERTVVNLARPIPIHITYMTAWVEDGVVNFRSDVYKHDAKLTNALAGRSMMW
jgi:murein L,D-transpeptidase YcbB/YkuD